MPVYLTDCYVCIANNQENIEQHQTWQTNLCVDTINNRIGECVWIYNRSHMSEYTQNT